MAYRLSMEQWWDEALRSTFADRDVIIAGAVPAAWTDTAEHLRSAGAGRILIVATEGAGLTPGPDVATTIVTPPAGIGMMERVRWSTAALRDPSPEMLTAVSEFDPRGRAIVIGTFLNEAPDLAGRPFLAHRRPEWVALEDKTTVDAIWDAAGVERLPSRVVPVGLAADAARSIDRGDGTVWAVDATQGFHGGAHGTRWVRDEASRGSAEAELGAIGEEVRVMPFVDGIPCSIHGVVLTDGTAVVRPVEMLTLRRGHALVYAGCATFWDPPDEMRVAMREAARRVAAVLTARLDFRGAFTVDGVVDADGFWPTELNPRFGAGLGVIERAIDHLPLLLLNDLAIAGLDIGVAADRFETELVSQADANRSGGTWRSDPAIDISTGGRAVRHDHSGWRWTDDDAAEGTVTSLDGFARCVFETGATIQGRSVAPLAADFWDFADAELSTGTGSRLGGLAPATDPFPSGRDVAASVT